MTKLQQYLLSNPTIAAMSAADAAAAINSTYTVVYNASASITTSTVYVVCGEIYGPAAGTARAIVILDSFQAMAAKGRPYSDFYAAMTSPQGQPIGSAVGLATLRELVAASLLLPAEYTEFAALAATTTYVSDGPVTVDDVSTAQALNAQAATFSTLQQRAQNGLIVAMQLINTYGTGPTTGTVPTAAQIQAAFARAFA